MNKNTPRAVEVSVAPPPALDWKRLAWLVFVLIALSIVMNTSFAQQLDPEDKLPKKVQQESGHEGPAACDFKHSTLKQLNSPLQPVNPYTQIVVKDSAVVKPVERFTIISKSTNNQPQPIDLSTH